MNTASKRGGDYLDFLIDGGGVNALFFINVPTRLFSAFQTNIKFLQQIYVKNVHPVYGAGIWTNDLHNMSLFT